MPPPYGVFIPSMVALLDHRCAHRRAPDVVLNPVVVKEGLLRFAEVYFETVSSDSVLPSQHLCLGRRTQVRVVLETAMNTHHYFHAGRHKPVEYLVVLPLLPEVGRPFQAGAERLPRIHCLSLR